MLDWCSVQVVFSLVYLLIYTIALIFNLIKNKFRFTTQLTVVTVVFFVALCIQLVSSYLMYDYSKDSAECEHNELSLTLIRASESLTMLIYMFLVWRMIFIYSKLFADRREKTCSQKSAQWASKH